MAVGLIFTGHSQCQTTTNHDHELAELPTIFGLEPGTLRLGREELTQVKTDPSEGGSNIVGDKFAGYDLFAKLGCGVCHSPNGINSKAPNPLSGVGTYSESFIRESIVNPTAYVRNGSTSLMPAFNSLTEEQIADLIAYVRAQFQ